MKDTYKETFEYIVRLVIRVFLRTNKDTLLNYSVNICMSYRMTLNGTLGNHASFVFRGKVERKVLQTGLSVAILASDSLADH